MYITSFSSAVGINENKWFNEWIWNKHLSWNSRFFGDYHFQTASLFSLHRAMPSLEPALTFGGWCYWCRLQRTGFEVLVVFCCSTSAPKWRLWPTSLIQLIGAASLSVITWPALAACLYNLSNGIILSIMRAVNSRWLYVRSAIMWSTCRLLRNSKYWRRDQVFQRRGQECSRGLIPPNAANSPQTEWSSPLKHYSNKFALPPNWKH